MPFRLKLRGRAANVANSAVLMKMQGKLPKVPFAVRSGGFAPQSRKGGVLQAPLSYLAVPKEEGERQKVRRHFIAQKYSNEALRFHKPHKGVIMRARAGL